MESNSKLPGFKAYDPVNNPSRDSKTLPVFENFKYSKEPTSGLVGDKSAIRNGVQAGQSLPEVEIFSHYRFNLLPTEEPAEGQYRGEPMRSLRTTFDVDLKGHPLDQAASSIIVYSGNWQFYDYQGNALSPILGPGRYDQLSTIFNQNDTISRFESVNAHPFVDTSP